MCYRRYSRGAASFVGTEYLPGYLAHGCHVEYNRIKIVCDIAGQISQLNVSELLLRLTFSLRSWHLISWWQVGGRKILLK